MAIFMNLKYECAAIRVALEKAVGSGTNIVDQAMKYAIEGAGRLYRPLTTVCVADAYGSKIENSVKAAVTVEMGNAASLIIDDMHDRVVLRRNKPSCWKRYGPGIAQMAAIKLILCAEDAAMDATGDLEINKRIQRVMNDGASKAIDGQVQDLNSTATVPLEYAIKIAEGKTAALFSASAVIGGLVARAPEDHLLKLDEFGRRIGIAFQIKDDIYDVEGDPAQGGKPVGQDKGKANIARIAGIIEAEKTKNNYIAEARAGLQPLGVKTQSLENLLELMFADKK